MDIDNAFPGDPVVVNEDGVIDAGQAPGDNGLSENAAVSRPSAECDLVSTRTSFFIKIAHICI